MAQHEATIPAEVLVVQSDANGIFHKTVHIAQRSVQNHGVAGVDAMPSVDAVLRHRRLSRLNGMNVSPVFFVSSLNGSPCLVHVYLATFTWNPVHARNIQT
jgi:hypothetical protein